MPKTGLWGHSHPGTHPTCGGTPCTWAPPLPQHLAAQKTYNNLDISVREALRQRTVCLEGVLTCYPHETMEDIIDRIAKEQVSAPGGVPPARQPPPCLLSPPSPPRDALPVPAGPSPGSGG